LVGRIADNVRPEGVVRVGGSRHDWQLSRVKSLFKSRTDVRPGY
jgi:hypothetical protein